MRASRLLGINDFFLSLEKNHTPDSIERKVVTVFLINYTQNGPEILLLRRSNRVSYYKGLWGAVSGTIEAGKTPEQQAFQEILEETSLTHADVTLVKKGEPFSVEDFRPGRKSLVHPFLFKVDSRAVNQVRLNWEHIEAHWITPSELSRYQTIKQLDESLKRVYP